MKCSHCSREAEDAQFKQCRACRERSREHYKANRERHLAVCREWQKAHPEQYTTSRNNWRKNNPEKTRGYDRKYYWASPEKYHEKCRKHREAKPEYHSARVSTWKKANPEKCNIQTHNRRARIKGNGGAFTFKELNELFEQQEGFCAYCGELLYSSFDKDIHIEHKTPVSRGGTSYISNIVLSCSKCNWEKGTKTHEEFLQARNA